MDSEQKGEVESVWEERLKIRSYDVDTSRKLRMESVLKYFQEAAWNHAEQLGLGYSHLFKQSRIWVLSRMMVVSSSYPEWGESVVVRTWPCGSMSLFALRDFELLDYRGRRLLGATSGWLVLDLQSRRAQRVEPILASIRKFPQRRALGVEAARLPPVTDRSTTAVLDVKYSDLDLNDHVNNTTYARWILDSYPIDFQRDNQIRSMVINFLAEVGGDDSVTLTTRDTGDHRMEHSVRRRIDGTEACRAEIVWEKRRTHSD